MSSIEIIQGSCADQEVDVVVNASNQYLVSGSGICGEIFRRAGYQELNDACSKLKRPVQDGYAAITDSFNMKNCKYIIHAVGPNFNRTPGAYEELFNAYYNSLKILKDNNLHSISFPLISAGIFGGNNPNPAQVSAKQCFKAYDKFIEEYPNYDIKVLLCAYLQSEYKEIKKVD